MNSMIGNNHVYIGGRLESEPSFSHALYGESFYSTSIAVSRLSGTFDVVPITLPERLMGDIMLRTGEYVLISGQLRSYNRIVDGVNRLVVTVFAHSLTPYGDECIYENEVTLGGYICKQVIFRTTPFSREVADILLAVNRAYNKSDYLPCIAWGRNARRADELSVGDAVEIKGRLQSREYQKAGADGETTTRTTYEVSASQITEVDAF